MEAKRASIMVLIAYCAGLSGCAMLQPNPGLNSNESSDTKRKEPAEIVRKPTSQPADTAGEGDTPNAIVQWAQGAIKARTAHEPPTPPMSHDAASGSVLAADQPAGEVFEATIPVQPTDFSPRVAKGPPSREIAVRREQPVTADESSSPTASPVAAKSAPPKLGGISVRPGSRDSAAPPAKKTNDTKITLNEPGDGRTVAGSDELKELLDDALAQPGDASFREQLDRKMLLVMKGEHEKAREPFVLASQAQQEMGRRLLEALIAVREGHDGDPGSEAAGVLAQVNQWRDSLLKVSDLSLPTFAICRAVRGFGQYEPIDPPRFIAGRESEFVAYCEITDFLSEKRDDAYVSNFSMKVAILDRTGDEVHAINADDIVDKCRARRSDCFLSPLVRLPASLAPGEYVARITIHDKIGKKVAEKVAKFRLTAKG